MKTLWRKAFRLKHVTRAAHRRAPAGRAARVGPWKWPVFSAINHTFFWRAHRPATGHFLAHLHDSDVSE